MPTGTVLEVMEILSLVVYTITIIITHQILLFVTSLSVQMLTIQTIQTVGHVMQATRSSVTSVSGGIISKRRSHSHRNSHRADCYQPDS